MTNGIHRETEAKHTEEVLLEEDIAEISKTNHPANPVVQHLQHQLANTIVLYLNYARCGWQAEGTSFFEIRAAFNGFAMTTKQSFGQLGDRLRMIGQDPEIGLESVIESSSVKQIRGNSSYQDLLGSADANVILVIREIRDAVRELRKSEDDPGSIDLLVSILKVHEGHEWALRQMARSSDQIRSV